MEPLSVAALERLSMAALLNAEALLLEAETLLAAKYYARAYFLGVSSIEETGKSAIALNATSRNLSDPKVAKTARNKILDHKSKIIAAFVPSIQLTSKGKLIEEIYIAIDLAGDLRTGREPSMYTEILSNGDIRSPSEIIKPKAANDVILLAKHCLIRAQEQTKYNQPQKASAASDFVYSQSAEKIQTIMESKGFAEFFMRRVENGSTNLDDAIYEFSNERD